jgi:hypothetical protein
MFSRAPTSKVRALSEQERAKAFQMVICIGIEELWFENSFLDTNHTHGYHVYKSSYLPAFKTKTKEYIKTKKGY